MKRVICAMLCAVCALFAINTALAAEDMAFIGENDLSSYILCDYRSGQVISERNSAEQVSDTGLSQMMSLLLFMEAIDSGRLALDDQVRISDSAAAKGGSQIFLEQGDSYDVETLLKGVIIVAANDACAALCERIAGSEEDFITMMNEKAGELGLAGTVFTSATGYMTQGETTTAADMAVICRALCRYPLIFDYSHVWQDSVTHSEGRVTDMVNANRLVRSNSACSGLAVGSSPAAGYSIAVTTDSADSKFIYIGLGAQSSKSRFAIADSVIEYVQNAYMTKSFVTKDQLIKKDYTIDGSDKEEIALYAENGIDIVIKKEDEAAIEKEFALFEDIALPLYAGTAVGKITISKNGKTLGETKVIVKEDIFEKTFDYAFKKAIGFYIA